MQTSSRKKIRGFNRKLKNLTKWKDYIISYPFKMPINGKAPLTFRLHLPPYYWYYEINPPITYTREIFKAFAEINNSLQNNTLLRENNLEYQLWLFYPRTIKSSITIAPHETLKEIVNYMIQSESGEQPLKIVEQAFPNYKWKVSKDRNFSSKSPGGLGPEWTTHEQGKIWIPL
jgi:hypothetical protein